MDNLALLYKTLDYQNGNLLPATDDPSHCENETDWVEKGEWLSAAKRAGAEKVFFVENNPVVIFAECGAQLQEKVKTFNRVWSLARPRILFLASPGEITVYDLAQKPVDENKEREWSKLKHLDVFRQTLDVTKQLQAYHRDHLESGRLFAEKRFGDIKHRADKSLIRDLNTVRTELVNAGLSGEKVKYAHALIGRSIFIRYLEDRNIVTEDYFLAVAKTQTGWAELLGEPAPRTGIDFSLQKTFYPRVLSSKEFTYALFKKLARDFNGDMFPNVDEEEPAVTQEHLTLMQDLLYGDIGVQKKLFFYSYRFNIVPLDLISSIYEAFYHETPLNTSKTNQRRMDGAFYTPPVLAEFLLSRVLTPEVLERNPRVLDPACGSGIFLVEAFRRIVRHKWWEKGQLLTFETLKNILKEQIAGIEVNEEAARITAFSLYLSMLHYLETPAIDRQIQSGNKLPNLLACDRRSENHFHCILAENAFDTKTIAGFSHWQERFGSQSVDVVIGNPPWGDPGTNVDQRTRGRNDVVVNWCTSTGKAIGDKEPSQAFLWRALDFLKTDGVGSMLVPVGVLLKHHPASQEFRKQWLQFIELTEVYNFSPVRKAFFKGSISPFVATIFKKSVQNQREVRYWSVMPSESIVKNQTVLLSRNNYRILMNLDLSDHRIWKIFLWGSNKDYDLLYFIENSRNTTTLAEQTLLKAVGFKKGNQKRKTPAWLLKYKKIKVTNSFCNYGNLRDDAFEKMPPMVERCGSGEELYHGRRLITLEAPRQAGGADGRLVARFVTEPFAFNHSFHVVKLKKDEDWMYLVLTGVLWSSLARYFLFFTSHFWGVWRDKVLVNERQQLPVIFAKENPATGKIIRLVETLRSYQPRERNALHPDGVPADEIKRQRKLWEDELDEAVFELYDLSQEQIDLIRDLCDTTLPFYYRPFKSAALQLVVINDDVSAIESYIKTFCRRWNAYLGADEEMRAQIHLGAHGNMVAVEFFPADKTDPWNLDVRDQTWSHIIEQIGEALARPMGTSQVVLDGLLHVITDSAIFIVKRNEKRLWTRSLAREDAEATICKRMVNTTAKGENHN